MGQMRVVGGDRDGNLERASAVVAEASGKGADLVVLPEALDLGWSHPCADRLATTIPEGISCESLSRAAAGHDVWLCAGIVEREGDRIFNAAVLIDRSGKVVLKHRKINELEFARSTYETGSEACVVDTEFGRIGVMICADAFIEGLTVSWSLGRKGAGFILSPCAWAVPADHDNETEPYGKLWIDSYRPVAEEFSLWIAGVSNVGPITAGDWAGRRCIGCSMLVDPSGQVVAQAPYGEDAEAIVFHVTGH